MRTCVHVIRVFAQTHTEIKKRFLLNTHFSFHHSFSSLVPDSELALTYTRLTTTMVSHNSKSLEASCNLFNLFKFILFYLLILFYFSYCIYFIFIYLFIFVQSSRTESIHGQGGRLENK